MSLYAGNLKTVTGTVVVQGGTYVNPKMRIIGATVRMMNSTTQTNSEGQFAVSSPCGVIEIEITHPDFHPYGELIALDPWTHQRINLGTIPLRYRGKPRRRS
ncbi:MAG TPA: carboxypeptidase regulatory-like domain-containing protein [Nitrospirae bacterium]|nr:carboxypeptidase regulatory-like domain-containing protein [Nitrospirota bacterium]